MMTLNVSKESAASPLKMFFEKKIFGAKAHARTHRDSVAIESSSSELLTPESQGLEAVRKLSQNVNRLEDLHARLQFMITELDEVIRR